MTQHTNRYDLMYPHLLCGCLCLLAGVLQSQPVAHVALPATPVQCHIDRAGDVYLVFEDGKIEKRNKDGLRVALATPASPFTSFDPANGQRLLGFDRHERRITWYYPSLSVYQTHPLDPAVAIEPFWVCTSGDRDFWLADAADQSLKKVRSADQHVLFEFPLPPQVSRVERWSELREYQGFLFAADPQHGLFIFNNLGRLIRTIDKKNLRHIRFLGEELFVQDKNQLEFFNLFTTHTRTEPLPEAAESVLLSDERMFLFQRQALKILAYQP